MVFAL
jgi:hypothetical protein